MTSRVVLWSVALLSALVSGCGAGDAPMQVDAALSGDANAVVDGGLAPDANRSGDSGAAPDAAAAGDAGASIDGGVDAGRDASADAGASVDTGPGIDGGPATCPVFGPSVQLGTIADNGPAELSGLVESRVHPGVLFGHNDNVMDLFAVRASDGVVLGHWTLRSGGVALGAGDVEDIAMGPMGDGSIGLYVGDIGSGSSVIRIARLPEPTVPLTGPPATGMLDTELMRVMDPLRVRIPNAETLLVDPIDGSVVIVQKNGTAHPCALGVFVGGSTVAPDCSAPAVAGIANPSAGDVSADGRFVIVRNETVSYVWVRPPGASLIAAFGGLRCPFPTLNHTDECNGEAIGFAADGLGVFTGSERTAGCPMPHLHSYTFAP